MKSLILLVIVVSLAYLWFFRRCRPDQAILDGTWKPPVVKRVK